MMINFKKETSIVLFLQDPTDIFNNITTWITHSHTHTHTFGPSSKLSST